MDIDYRKLFELEAEDLSGPEQQGEESPAGEESAGPAEEPNEEAEQEGQEPSAEPQGAPAAGNADPASQEGQPSAEAEPTGGETAPKEGNKQSRGDNAKYAAARRRAEAERDAEIRRIRQESRREIDAAVAGLNLTDPYTGEKIATKEQYDAYQTKYSREQKAEFMRKNGLDEAGYQQVIGALPEVREAREQQQQAEAAELASREDRARVNLERELQEIHKLDPKINGLEDLAGLPNYDEFLKRVKANYSLVDAFKATQFDALMERREAAGKQAARNAASGKQHMQTHTERGTGGVTVPEDVKAAYRFYLPDATDAEIAAHYARDLANSKK